MAAPIIVVTGPPGAGKTTVCRQIGGSFEQAVHLPLDDLWPWITAGWIEPWRPESHAQNEVVLAATQAAAVQFASGGYTVVFDGLVLPWALARFGTAAATAGVPLHLVVLRPPLPTCLERAATRDQGLADPDVVAHLHAQFADLGDLERHVLDDGTAPAIVAAVASGRMLVG